MGYGSQLSVLTYAAFFSFFNVLQPPAPEDLAVICFTSGTTGKFCNGLDSE